MKPSASGTQTDCSLEPPGPRGPEHAAAPCPAPPSPASAAPPSLASAAPPPAPPVHAGDLEAQHAGAQQDEAASVASGGSDGASWLELRFQLLKDALRFKMFIMLTWAAAYAYSLASCTMFFSSLYPVPSRAPNATYAARAPSPVDALLMTSHILAVDMSSAFFVLAGFFSAYTFANIASRDRAELCKVVVIYALVDVWLAGLLSLLFGSIFHLAHHSFRAHDLALTALEAGTCIRAFEFRQDAQSWHSLNPTSWPVLCLLYCFLLTPCTLTGNERLRRCHPRAGILIPWINASMPIVVISLFALVHDDTNIFFINASNLGYRLLEFNLGICFYNAMNNCPHAFWKFAAVVTATCPYVLATFVFIWWAQLGAPVRASDDTCVRMYYFSPCIHMHHGFLMRGCFLGVTLMCAVLTSSEERMERIAKLAPMQSHSLSACITATLITWPTCYVVHTLLEANFGQQLVQDNAALLVLAVPHLVFAVSLLWDTSSKIHVFNTTERALDRALRWRHRPSLF